MLPEGLTFVASWVTGDLSRCFVVMECESVATLQRWVVEWSDLAEFEIVKPGLSGLIFEDQSAPSLAAAMGRILDGELDPQACKAHARGRIEQDYNPMVQAKRIVEAVQECLQGRAGGG